MAAALLVAASPAAAQSSHLAQLESTVPALASDPVTAIAEGGWVSAWIAPAAGGDVTGALVGLEHSGFAAMTTTLAAVRIDVGPTIQLTFAQTRLKDLFDDALLSQFPELGTLRATATQVGLDVALGLGGWAAASLGGRYERDEFLGDVGGLWLARASAAGPRLMSVRSILAVERAIGGGRFSKAGAGRLTLGLGRRLGGDGVAVTVGVGGTAGDVWAAGSRRRTGGVSVRLTLLDRLMVNGAVGGERDVYGDGGWLGFASFGVGLSLGPVRADVRHGGVGAADAAPTAVSVLYEPR